MKNREHSESDFSLYKGTYYLVASFVSIVKITAPA